MKPSSTNQYPVIFIPSGIRRTHSIFIPSVILWTSFIFIFILSSCVSPKMLRELSPKEGDLIKTELYFGMNIPGGGLIDQTDWVTFLSDEITPKFPNGLTVHEANGQWLGEDGKIARERSRIVVLVYPYSAEKEKAINEIMAAYKLSFKQEAVLRIDSRARWSF